MLGGCSSVNAQMYSLVQRRVKVGIIVERGPITIDGLNLRMIHHGHTTHFYLSLESLRDLRTRHSTTATSLNRHRKSTMVEMANGKSRISLTSIKFRHTSF